MFRKKGLFENQTANSVIARPKLGELSLRGFCNIVNELKEKRYNHEISHASIAVIQNKFINEIFKLRLRKVVRSPTDLVRKKCNCTHCT